jgi:hypothetical protein
LRIIDSWPEKKYEFFCPPPIPKKNVDREEDSAGAMTGTDYDLMLHCTIGHMHRVNGAKPPFEDGEKTLGAKPPFEDGEKTLTGNRQHRYVFCIFC